MDNISARLAQLFAQSAGAGGRPVTMQEILNRMNERGIATMSMSYLHQLRTGQADNPRIQHLRALADAFGVPLSYFTEDEAGTSASELTPRMRRLAFRAHGLSEDWIRLIEENVELARKNEGLDGPGESDGGE